MNHNLSLAASNPELSSVKPASQVYQEFYDTFGSDKLSEEARRQFKPLLKNRVLTFEDSEKPALHLIMYQPQVTRRMHHARSYDTLGGFEVSSYDRQGFVAFTCDGASGTTTWYAEQVSVIQRDNGEPQTVQIGLVTERGERAQMQLSPRGDHLYFEATGLQAQILDEVTSESLRQQALFVEPAQVLEDTA